MPEPITAPIAPAAPVAPAPSPSPAPAPFADIKSSPFSALDAKARAVPAKVEPAKGSPKDGVEPKGDPIRPAQGKEEPAAQSPKWYREQQAKFEPELKARDERIKQMEARIAEAESKGKDVSLLTDRLTKLEQERDGLRGELRAARQEVSPEFKDKWDKPFNQAAEYAKTMVTQFQVGEWKDDESTGTKIWQPTRTATWEDFAELYAMPMNKAASKARQMFHEDAGLGVTQLTGLHRLDFQRANALQEEKANWKANSDKEEAQRVQSEHGFKAMLSEVQKHLADTNPDFQDKPGDEGKESRELREEGYKLFDNKPQTIQDAATKSAYVRHIVAAHAPLIRQRDGLQAKVKELESTIAELRGNKPGPSVRPTKESGGTDAGDSWMDDLRKNVSPS